MRSRNKNEGTSPSPLLVEAANGKRQHSATLEISVLVSFSPRQEGVDAFHLHEICLVQEVARKLEGLHRGLGEHPLRNRLRCPREDSKACAAGEVHQ